MEYFDLVNNECFKLNKILDLRYDGFFFIEASLQKIIFGNIDETLIFSYSPERYEYGKSMVLKGLIVRVSNNKEYPVSQVVSFLRNECQLFEENNELYSLEHQLDNYDTYKILSKSYPNWEEKYQSYIKKKYPW